MYSYYNKYLDPITYINYVMFLSYKIFEYIHIEVGLCLPTKNLTRVINLVVSRYVRASRKQRLCNVIMTPFSKRFSMFFVPLADNFRRNGHARDNERLRPGKYLLLLRDGSRFCTNCQTRAVWSTVQIIPGRYICIIIIIVSATTLYTVYRAYFRIEYSCK